LSTTNLSEKLLKSVEIANTITVIDIQEFVLKNPLKLTSDLLSQVANQLFFYNKIKTKVPLWYENKQLVAPPKVSIEQCSSQFTAQYKASLCAGTNGLDLTGGMGVDSYFLSKNFKKFIYNEPNSTLFELAKYNFSALNLSNIIFNNLSANAFLTQNKETFDLIYIDPSRRDLYNNKKIKIEDCEPNLKAINTELLNSCQTLMVKYSPMLDIKNSIKSLLNIHKIIILADKNEVKELLFILIKELNNDPEIVCVNQTSSGKLQEFKFLFSRRKINKQFC
jgi:16S rRNA G966 N2-methylase RsmD